MAGEFVREKILERTREEVPHATGVVVESWEDGADLVRILATIVVDKSSQRAILLGRGGQFIKNIGMDSRKEIEEMLGKKIFLELHVRVEEGWRQNPRTLREMYD
jgi:GTP-binding protein Era